MKVYIEYSSGEYAALFRSLFGATIVSDWKEADLICFTGGADVSPYLYKDKQHPATGNDVFRDKKEEILFHNAKDSHKPMVGICRGGQFLNVMCGGRMYQDVSGHGMSHELIDLETGETIYVSSTHHQMMMPGHNGRILATSTGVTSRREWFDHQIFCKDVTEEGIEVVSYPEQKVLCFQPHPECTDKQFSGMHAYFKRLVEALMAVQATPVAESV